MRLRRSPHFTEQAENDTAKSAMLNTPIQPSFTGRRFHNPDGNAKPYRVRDLVKWHWERKAKLAPVNAATVPWQLADTTVLHSPSDQARLTWLGHASVLLQYHNTSILTDPVFSQHCSPLSFMQQYHVNPAEAVQIHQDINAKWSFGIHWGTFQLTDEPINEPPQQLHLALQEAKLPLASFETLAIGETRTIPSLY